MTLRGGAQIIPRPTRWAPGGPAPWAHLPSEDRRIDLAALRRAFNGRVGAPSFIEAEGTSLPSAVLAAFYEGDEGLEVILTRRSWALRAHTGEVSFPGGRADPGETAQQAALREAFEEVALPPDSVEILGELDHLMTITSRSFIVPLVGLLSSRPKLIANPQEVDAVLHVPVAELLLDEVFREELWVFEHPPPWVAAEALQAGDPVQRQIFFFEIVGDTVWGATAAMLRHLFSVALGLGGGIDHA